MANHEPETSANPYQSPQADLAPRSMSELESESKVPILVGQRWFRGALTILAVPALINFVAFDQTYVRELPSSMRMTSFLANASMMFLAGAALWFRGYNWMEWLLTIPRILFFANLPDPVYRDVVREAMYIFFIGSIGASIAWVLWIVSFYMTANHALFGLPEFITGVLVIIWLVILVRGLRNATA